MKKILFMGALAASLLGGTDVGASSSQTLSLGIESTSPDSLIRGVRQLLTEQLEATNGEDQRELSEDALTATAGLLVTKKLMKGQVKEQMAVCLSSVVGLHQVRNWEDFQRMMSDYCSSANPETRKREIKLEKLTQQDLVGAALPKCVIETLEVLQLVKESPNAEGLAERVEGNKKAMYDVLGTLGTEALEIHYRMLNDLAYAEGTLNQHLTSEATTTIVDLVKKLNAELYALQKRIAPQEQQLLPAKRTVLAGNQLDLIVGMLDNDWSGIFGLALKGGNEHCRWSLKHGVQDYRKPAEEETTDGLSVLLNSLFGMNNDSDQQLGELSTSVPAVFTDHFSSPKDTFDTDNLISQYLKALQGDSTEETDQGETQLSSYEKELLDSLTSTSAEKNVFTSVEGNRLMANTNAHALYAALGRNNYIINGMKGLLCDNPQKHKHAIRNMYSTLLVAAKNLAILQTSTTEEGNKYCDSIAYELLAAMGLTAESSVELTGLMSQNLNGVEDEIDIAYNEIEEEEYDN